MCTPLSQSVVLCDYVFIVMEVMSSYHEDVFFLQIEEDIERAHGMICEGDVGALLPHKYNGKTFISFV